MAKSCRICEKTVRHGSSRRHNTTSNISRHGAWGHRATKTNRKWKANLRKAIILTENNVVKKDWVCMKCYKKARA